MSAKIYNKRFPLSYSFFTPISLSLFILYVGTLASMSTGQIQRVKKYVMVKKKISNENSFDLYLAVKHKRYSEKNV